MAQHEPRRMPFSVSVVHNTAADGKLSKAFQLDLTQKNLKTETDAILTEGSVAVEHFESLGLFMDRRSRLTPAEALLMGLPMYGNATIVTQKALRSIPAERQQAERIIARDRAHISWAPGPAVVMLDLDSPDRFPPELQHLAQNSPEQWRELLIELVPGLEDVPMAWAPSSSSYLYNGEEELAGLRGQRFYFVIDIGVDTPQFKEAFRNALVQRDLVWFEISKSGSLLERYPFDLAVYQPERLDFAAEPVCTPPVERRPQGPIVWQEGGLYFSAASVPDVAEREGRIIKAKLQDLRRAKAGEAATVRERWIEETGRHIALRRPDLEPAAATEVARQAVQRDVLLGDFILIDSKGNEVSVGELLEAPHVHEGRRFHDPLEPGYRNDPRIAVMLLDHTGRPLIHSHAHGGQTFRCQSKAIRIAVGTMDETTDRLAAALDQDAAGLYLNGNAIVGVDEVEARMLPLEGEGLALRLQRVFDVMKVGTNGKTSPTDLPPRHVKAFMSVASELPIPRLTAVVNAPFARAEGSIVDTPGYDAASEVLYLSPSCSPPTVRRELGVLEAQEALKKLWYPFSEFPLVSDLDSGALLAAILSTVLRQSVGIAPGYLFKAPTAGVGKTKLAESVGALQTGAWPPVSALPRGDDEIRKHLFAALRQGRTYLLYDNAERGSEIDSPVLANLTTSPEVQDRVLGASLVETRPNRMTVALTGNNVSLCGDLNRRILPIALDPHLERPWERRFDFEPVPFILANRVPLRIAGLEVIAAWRNGGARPAEGSTGFPEWDAVVRSTVAWVIDHLDIGVGFADPKDAIRKAYSEDPEAEPLGHLLAALHDVIGEREFQLKDVEDIINAIDGDPLTDLSDVEEPAHATPGEILREARDVALGNLRTYEDGRVALGRYLSKHDGRVVGNLRLERGGKRGGSRCWRVIRVRSGGDSTGGPDRRRDDV